MEKNTIQESIEDLLSNMGLSLVEMNIGHSRRDTRIYLVLDKIGGISIDDLGMAQKVLRPRFELEFGRDRLSLEISSPGIARKIKHNREYSIFIGRHVKVLTNDGWLKGIVKHADTMSVTLNTDCGIQKLDFAKIRKGKLD